MRPALSLVLVACALPPDDGSIDAPHWAGGVIDDQASYTAACEALLGALPPLACADAAPIPIHVTDAAGTREVHRSADLEDGFRCDAPSSLSACTPGSRFARGVTARGVPWALLCRRYRDEPGGYDQIALIASDPDTGATCFWSTPDDGLRRDDPIPRPGAPEDVGWSWRSFWYTLDELAANSCVSCHDNDPWVRNPWIAPMGVPSAALGPYRVVGAEVLGWSLPPRLVHPDAAPCTGCHHLSTGLSCELAQDATGHKGWRVPVSSSHTRWPRSHWMDDFDPEVLAARYASQEAWEARYGAAVAAITACCAAPDDPTCWAPVE